MTMAPIGARLVHSIDKNLLGKIFGAFLIIVSIRAFIEFLNFNYNLKFKLKKSLVFVNTGFLLTNFKV